MLRLPFVRIKYAILLPLFLILSCRTEAEIEPSVSLASIQVLPELLSENSGMIEFESLFWFINDSGNKPELYGYDKSSNEIIRTVEVSGAENTDWEDITQNEEYIFIGDFGNNGGNRTNLRIYIIDKSDLGSDTETVEPAGIIYFNYETQTDFTYSKENTPFDCEAFIAADDTILLFTKDWSACTTSIFSIPSVSGTYTARFRLELDVNGLVTSAARASDGQQDLLLLGYTPLIPFLWIFEDFNAEDLSFTSKERQNFIDNFATQTEGLLVSEDSNVYISSESVTELSVTKAARLFVFTAGN